MQYVLVGIGGALGSIVRYSLGKAISEKFNKVVPLATLIVNITGAILLGIISNIVVGSNLSLLLADGFLGAYTTFSTFMYEGFSLFKDNRNLNAFVYILSSLILGIIGFVLGLYFSSIFK